MYAFLLMDDNQLIAINRERIMQRSKLVDKFGIRMPKLYKQDIDMSEFSPMIEYMLPISKKYVSEVLTYQEDEEHEDYLLLTLPFDTKLTTEDGQIEFQLTFVKVDMDEDGNNIQYVRKTSTATITILPIAKWADIIPDEALNAVDQKLLKAEALLNQINDLAESIDLNKADNIEIGVVEDEKAIYLTSHGDPIGDAIPLDELGDEISESDNDGLIKIVL